VKAKACHVEAFNFQLAFNFYWKKECQIT